MDYSLPGSSVRGIIPGKNTGVGCRFLLQGTFLTQGIFPTSNPHFLHCQVDFLPPGSKEALYTYIFSSVSSVAQSCPTLCDPMNRSMQGLPVHHQLLEFTQTPVYILICVSYIFYIYTYCVCM